MDAVDIGEHEAIKSDLDTYRKIANDLVAENERLREENEKMKSVILLAMGSRDMDFYVKTDKVQNEKKPRRPR